MTIEQLEALCIEMGYTIVKNKKFHEGTEITLIRPDGTVAVKAFKPSNKKEN